MSAESMPPMPELPWRRQDIIDGARTQLARDLLPRLNSARLAVLQTRLGKTPPASLDAALNDLEAVAAEL